MDQLNIICHDTAGLIRGSSVFRAVLRRQFEHLYQFFDGCEFCRIPHQWKLIAAGGNRHGKGAIVGTACAGDDTQKYLNCLNGVSG